MYHLILVFVFFASSGCTDGQIQSSATCAIPAQSADKTFTIFDAEDHPVKGERVSKGGYINLQCANGYLFSDGSNTSTSVCRPTSTAEWHPAIKSCLRICPPLKSVNVDLTCKYKGHEFSCEDNPMFSGTHIRPRCKDLHHLNQNLIPDYTTIRCKEDGTWNKKLFKCDPDCGIPKALPLLVGGSNATLGQFPWHVAIYSVSRGYLLICSGTLIAPNIVLSAAHCFYNESFGIALTEPTDYAIVVGKLTRDYTKIDDSMQRSLPISEILFYEKPYNPKLNGYTADIALIVLKKRAVVSAHVLPACFRSYQRLGFNPGSGAMGVLAGWGMDESDRPTDVLQTVRLPFMHYSQCVGKLPGVTHDKFCTGTEKGAKPRSGDSGGGLVFKDPNTNFYYVRGVVSTTERFSEAGITSFTDLSYYQDWIDQIISEKSRKQTDTESETKAGISTTTTTTAKTTRKEMTPETSSSSSGAKLCPPLQTHNVDLTCKLRRKEIDCNGSLMIGTEVAPRCKPVHYIDPEFDPDYTSIRCLSDGRWENTLFRCVPDCGMPTQQTLVSYGNKAELGQLPWLVAIYKISVKKDRPTNQHTLICSGTLISTNVVLSVAHCFYDPINKKAKNKELDDYYVTVGKITSNSSIIDNAFQKTFQISEILFSEKPYNPAILGTSSDIAMIILKESITVSPYVHPACFRKYTRSGFNPGNGMMGILGGWGIDETDKPSEVMKTIRLPYLNYEECAKNMTSYTLEIDKFCVGAGQDNGSPQKGDSGAGLVFKDPYNSKYYIRGILSIRGGMSSSVTLYTDISYYEEWIDRVIQEKSENVQNKSKSSSTTNAFSSTKLTF